MLGRMAGFAAGTFLGKPIIAEILADINFSQFICIFGRLRLIIVDTDNMFCGFLDENLREFRQPSGSDLT
jgi:hypothetical protein